MKYFELSFEIAHARAKEMLKESFYWDFRDKDSPFGNMDGSDAFYDFREWRLKNPQVQPLIYLQEAVDNLGYQDFPLEESSSEKVQLYLSKNTDEESTGQADDLLDMFDNISLLTKVTGGPDRDSMKNMFAEASSAAAYSKLNTLDNLVIGVGFGQLVLEGSLDRQLRDLTVAALRRELLPLSLDMNDSEDKEKRKQQLEKMLEDIQKAG